MYAFPIRTESSFLTLARTASLQSPAWKSRLLMPRSSHLYLEFTWSIAQSTAELNQLGADTCPCSLSRPGWCQLCDQVLSIWGWAASCTGWQRFLSSTPSLLTIHCSKKLTMPY